MATLSLNVAAAMQPVYRENSTVTKVQSVVTSATASAGDVWILNNIKIPHRAIVTNVAMKGSVVDGTYILEVGTQGSGGTADIFGSKTLSATAVLALTQLTLNVPTTISVSDDSVDRFQTFMVRVDGTPTSGTTSMSLQFIVQYTCP